MFIIRHVDPTDSDNFLMSESVHSVAKAYGWWNNVEENGLLDFTKIYSDGEYAHKYYSGRRMWGGYHLACPSQNFPSEYSDLQSDPVYPVYAKPDYLISEMDMFRFHRYTYQGTQFDLSAENNLAGGPFGTPDRWKAGKGEDEVKGNWERSIGLYRTSDTYVVVSREQHTIQQGEENNGDKKDSDGGLGAILWFASASPLGSVFTPFIVGLSDIPKSYRSGHQKVFDRTSAFWAACYVANVANLKWSYAIQDVQSRQNQLEKSSLEMIQQMDEHYAKTRDMDKVESIYFQNIQTIVASLWSLSDEIMFKYASGFVNELPERMGQMVGYPAWWLKKVGFQDGPPPPPTEPKCCNPSPHDSDRLASRNNNISSKNLRKEKEEKNKRNSEVELDYRQPMLTGKAAMKQFVLNQNQINTPTSTK
jgi:dipeptidase